MELELVAALDDSPCERVGMLIDDDIVGLIVVVCRVMEE